MRGIAKDQAELETARQIIAEQRKQIDALNQIVTNNAQLAANAQGLVDKQSALLTDLQAQNVRLLQLSKDSQRLGKLKALMDSPITKLIATAGTVVLAAMSAAR